MIDQHVTTLWTIGYEKTSWPDVLATLRAAGVAQVIDVRQLPLSRRAGFSKRQLAAGLAEAGIGYVHLRALGTPAGRPRGEPPAAMGPLLADCGRKPGHP